MSTAASACSQVLIVKDRVAHQPLELVNIYSENPRAFTVTNAEGIADLSGFKGADSIHVEMIGYLSVVCSYKQLEEMQFKLFLEETLIFLDQVVVSATRWRQESGDIPNKIIAIRRAQIQMQNPQTAADLLGSSGEVYIQKSQLGGGSPVLRGFATNRILITVDGVRMNTAICRSGNMQNVISLDPFAIENTEVLFGPGSMIYGSDAIGGVMGFYTLEPKFSSGGRPLVKGSVVARNSSADFEKTGHFDIHIGLEKWAFVTSGTYTDYDDLKMGSNGPDDYLRQQYVATIDGRDSVVANPDPRKQVFTGYSQLNLMQKVRFRPNDQWDFNYGFHYSISSDIPRYDRLIEVRKGQLRSAEWFYGPQKWCMNGLNIQHTGQKSLYDNARLTLAYQFFEESRHDRSFGSVNLHHRTETVDVFSANLDFEKTVSQKYKVFYGVEVILNTVGSEAEEEDIETGEGWPISTRYPDGSTWNSYAAYSNYRFNMSSQLTLQAGLRYNRITMNSEFDTRFFPFPFTSATLNTGALTWSAGVVYCPEKSWAINLNLATGFRAPNVDDMGKVFDSEPGSVIVPNPYLKPEFAYNVELGVAKIFNNVAKVDVTGYTIHLDDALVRREFFLNGQDSVIYDGTPSQVLAIQNAAEAFVWGVQAGVEIKLPAGFGIFSRFNYQKGEEELDDGSTAPLRHAGPWFGVTHLTYKRDRIKVDLYAVYNGAMAFEDLAPSEQNKPHLYAVDENGSPYSPGWTTLNIKVNAQLTDHLVLSAGIENIMDRRYRPYSSGISAPGRNFIAALKMNF